jgi:hypothetical protein
VEILDFLNKNGLATERWIALDDDPEIYTPECKNLILCVDGFRDTEEELLRKAFCNFMRKGNP